MRPSKLALALVALSFSLVPLAVGCHGTVIVNGHDPRCPADFPDGAACSDEGVSCTYEAAGCDLVYECSGGTWSGPTSTCATSCMGGDPESACLSVGETCGFGENCYYEEWTCTADHTWDVYYEDGGPDCCYGECGCEPIYCPSVPPQEGESCDPCWDSGYCSYYVITACGDQEVTMACGPDYVWTKTSAEQCDCSFHQTVEECEADPSCRYLTGGCEMPALEQPGCFPKTDCGPDQPCPDGKMCNTFNANTCSIDPCIECTTVGVCL